jgi:uncharacterized protein (TIGR03435 family)
MRTDAFARVPAESDRRLSANARSIGVALLSLTVATPFLRAQKESNTAQIAAPAPSAPSASGRPEFEVATVRPSPPDAPMRGTDLLFGVDPSTPPGGLFSASAPLMLYISFAYGIGNLSEQQTLNAHLPKWAQTAQFDIQARAEGNPTLEQLRLMMKTLLEDRFKLITHVEQQQVRGYALVLVDTGKVGSQLREHPRDVPCLARPDKPAPVAPGTVPPPYCGGDAWRASDGQLHMRMIDATMEQIASFLGASAGMIGGLDNRPIFDQTGLKGKFDIDLQFVMEKNGPAAADSSSGEDVPGPTFTKALKDQLGLKLVSQEGSVSTLVVDHIEEPSAN